MTASRKPLFWIGSSLDDLREFPADVKEEMGYALHIAQMGQKHVAAKPLKGFGRASALEVVSDHDGDTFRAVYTVKFKGAIYVLHAFQKKSKRGIETPKKEIQLVKARLNAAGAHYLKWSEGYAKESKRKRSPA